MIASEHNAILSVGRREPSRIQPEAFTPFIAADGFISRTVLRYRHRILRYLNCYFHEIAPEHDPAGAADFGGGGSIEEDSDCYSSEGQGRRADEVRIRRPRLTYGYDEWTTTYHQFYMQLYRYTVT